MAELGRQLDNMVIRATSPDNQIMASLRNLRNITIQFRSGSYEQYEAAALEVQLSQLLETLWTGYRKGVRMALDSAGGEAITTAGHWDAKRRRYYLDLEKLAFSGISPNRCLGLRSVAMKDVEFKIRPGTLEHMDESQFIYEFNGTISAMMADRAAKTTSLKDKYFDLQRPVPGEIVIPG